MNEDKKIPNPYGRKGGLKHQEKVEEIALEIRDKKRNPVKEFFIRLFTNDKAKFIDVAEFEEDGNLIDFYQVGKQNKNGEPVKRERDALDEIELGYGVRPKFYSYNTNTEEGNE